MPGFEPGPHWWEVSALTTAPPQCSLNWCITTQSALIKRLLNKIGVGYTSLALVCVVKYTLIAWFSFLLLRDCLYGVSQPG